MSLLLLLSLKSLCDARVGTFLSDGRKEGPADRASHLQVKTNLLGSVEKGMLLLTVFRGTISRWESYVGQCGRAGMKGGLEISVTLSRNLFFILRLVNLRAMAR